MWSWRGFSTDWRAFIGPLLVVAVTVSLGGVALRRLRVPELAAGMLQVLMVLLVVWVILGGSVIHPLAASHEIAVAIRDAWISAATNTAPVPENVPSIAPLVIVCGAGVLVLVDVLACRLGRMPLAGLALAAVYAVPITELDEVVPWQTFAIAAAGFLVMMSFQQSAHVARWGRSLGAIDPDWSGARTGTLRSRGGVMGAGAVLLAVTLPAVIPTVPAGQMFHGRGGHSVRFTDLMTTMQRGLHQQQDVPLLDVATDDPDPSYLRLGVLTEFDGEQWTSGGRDGGHQVGDGTLPILEQGLSTGALEGSHEYTVTATNSFDSTWLPTQFPVSRIVASGTWDYDVGTMDVFAADSETNAAGGTYQMTAEVPRLSARSLSHAPAAPPDILTAYTAPADSLPPPVHDLAVQVTGGARNPYRMAVRLQDWFRTGGGFRYDLAARATGGDDALVDFLSRGPGGRVGGCAQFASAYAAMAQVLGIPARVAVGFLEPSQGPDGDWIYSSHDYHAWPELYFQGSGWVRFEPTPASRAATVPPWTRPAPKARPGSTGPDVGPATVPANHLAPTSSPEPTTAPAATPSDAGGARAVLLETLAGLLVLVVLMPIPGAVRRSRRGRRLAGGVEEAWAELRDTAIDLGLSWPAGRSPHQTGLRLAEWFAEAPGAERALDRIVLVLEQVRYALSANDTPGALARDLRVCLEALEEGRPRRTLWRARWVPRSVFPRRFTVRRAVEPRPEAKATCLHDHIG
jgi:transglutaminase-like putative cysteine protease